MGVRPLISRDSSASRDPRRPAQLAMNSDTSQWWTHPRLWECTLWDIRSVCRASPPSLLRVAGAPVRDTSGRGCRVALFREVSGAAVFAIHRGDGIAFADVFGSDLRASPGAAKGSQGVVPHRPGIDSGLLVCVQLGPHLCAGRGRNKGGRIDRDVVRPGAAGVAEGAGDESDREKAKVPIHGTRFHVS